MNQVIGNLLSSLVFSGFTNTDLTDQSKNFTQKINFLNESSSVNYSLCGSNDIPSQQDKFDKPNESLVNRLFFIYACLSLAGILILIIFLDNIKPQNAKGVLFYFLILLFLFYLNYFFSII